MMSIRLISFLTNRAIFVQLYEYNQIKFKRFSCWKCNKFKNMCGIVYLLSYWFCSSGWWILSRSNVNVLLHDPLTFLKFQDMLHNDCTQTSKEYTFRKNVQRILSNKTNPNMNENGMQKWLHNVSSSQLNWQFNHSFQTYEL